MNSNLVKSMKQYNDFHAVKCNFVYFSECLIHKDEEMALEELLTLKLPSNGHHGRNKRFV